MKLRTQQAGELWARAKAAGKHAARAKAEKLQISKAHAFAIVERENPLDDASPIVAVHGYVWDSCGFAWLNIRNTNRHPAKGLVDYLKAIGVGYSDSYYGGYTVWGSVFYRGQEITSKEEGCRKAAEVLWEAGIEADVGSRLD